MSFRIVRVACSASLLPNFAPCTLVLATSSGQDTLAARIPTVRITTGFSKQFFIAVQRLS